MQRMLNKSRDALELISKTPPGVIAWSPVDSLNGLPHREGKVASRLGTVAHTVVVGHLLAS